MKVVQKFDVALVSGPQNIKMPVGSEILHIGRQRSGLCIWALCDSVADIYMRVVQVVGTGDHLDFLKKENYLGTVVEHIYVWHLFDLK